MAAKVVAHELGHYFDPWLAEHPQQYAAHRGDCEAVAESVAFVVAASFGLDAGPAAVGYVAAWVAGDAARVRDLAERIGHGLAVFPADDFRQAVTILDNQIAQVEHDLGAARQRRGPPFDCGGLGCGDRAIHIFDAGKAYLRDHLAGCRIGDGALAPGGCRFRLAVDPVRDSCRGQCFNYAHRASILSVYAQHPIGGALVRLVFIVRESSRWSSMPACRML